MELRRCAGGVHFLDLLTGLKLFSSIGYIRSLTTVSLNVEKRISIAILRVRGLQWRTFLNEYVVIDVCDLASCVVEFCSFFCDH